MPDAIFADPRLARLYDLFDEPRDDLSLYLEIAAGVGARSVLDLGCGTGSFATLLADAGLTVFGVDPALASSVFITTLTDMIGFLSFLGLATVFLRFLQQAPVVT